MFKIYGKGDTVSNDEFWDGRTKYNLLQKFIQGSYTSYKDLIDPIKDILNEQFEMFDFLEKFAELKIPLSGVFKDSFQNECIINANDIITLNINSVDKKYTRLSPGIIAFNSNIFINKPATELAATELEQILNLNNEDDETVEIKYSYSTDSFKARITKKLDDKTPIRTYEYTNDSDWNNDNDIGYQSGIELLYAIYIDDVWKESLISKIGDDLTKINLEKTYEIENDSLYFWCMNNTGDVLLQANITNEFQICSFEMIAGVVSNIDNNHIIYSAVGESNVDENGMIVNTSTNGVKFIDDSGSEIKIDDNGDVSLSNDTFSITLSGNDLIITGNLVVQGTSTQLQTQTLEVEDNIVEINKGLITEPLPNMTSGIKINRGPTLDPYYLIFDEDTGFFKLGTLTDLKNITVIHDNAIDTGIPIWDEVNKQFITSNLITWNGTKLIADIDTIDGFHANDNDIADNDLTLTTKNKVKAFIDNGVGTILDNHENNTGNPHNVTKAQVGLGNTPNWSGSTNILLGSSNSIIPSQLAIKTYVDDKVDGIDFAHFTQTDNPHEVSKTQIGLSNVPNWIAGGTILADNENSFAMESAVIDQLALKSATTHLHDDRYYTETELNNLLNLKANSADVYSKTLTYTKTEINNLLALKSATTHLHDDRYYTETELDNALGEKANSIDVYTKTLTYTKTEINDALALKSNTTHLHDSRYYTETEMNNLLANKANSIDVYTKEEVDQLIANSVGVYK